MNQCMKPLFNKRFIGKFFSGRIIYAGLEGFYRSIYFFEYGGLIRNE